MFQSNFYLNSKNFDQQYLSILETKLKVKKFIKCYDDAHNRYNKLFDLTFKRNEIWGSYLVLC